MRRSDRQVTAHEEIRDILNSCKICRIGMVDDGKPYVVPLNHGFEYDNGALTVYFHCAGAGRKLEIIKKTPNVFFEVDFDGSAYGNELEGCTYSARYASVMADGVVEILEDYGSKVRALDAIMKHQTGMEGFTYDKNIERTTVCKITCSNVTAKANKGE